MAGPHAILFADILLFADIFLINKVIECPTPDAPAKGNVTHSGKKLGDKASYTCGKGYILQGPIFRHCQLHGQWSQSMPQCIGKFAIIIFII